MKKFAPPIILLLVLAGMVSVGTLLHEQFDPHVIEASVLKLGIWAPAGFILLYALATLLFLPGAVLTITGGFLFGPVYGTLYNITGATLGATGAFLIARYLAADWVAQHSAGKLEQLRQGVQAQGWKFIAVVRLIPLLPFNLLNYALGLTPVSVLAYSLASFLFMLPGAAAYTYVGSLGRTALAGETEQLIRQVFIAIGLLVIVMVLPWLIKRSKHV